MGREVTNVERALTGVIGEKLRAYGKRNAAREALAAAEAAQEVQAAVEAAAQASADVDLDAEIAAAEKAGDWRRAGALKLTRWEDAR